MDQVKWLSGVQATIVRVEDTCNSALLEVMCRGLLENMSLFIEILSI